MMEAIPPSATAFGPAFKMTLTLFSSRQHSCVKNSRPGRLEWLPWSALAALTIGTGILGLAYPDAIVAAYNNNYLFPG